VTDTPMNPTIRQLGVPVALGGVPEAGKAEVLALYPHARFNPHPRALTEDEMIEFLGDCDAAIIGLDTLSARVIEALPNLRIVGKFGAGYDTVDFEAVKRKGIMFGYTWGVNALAVAELTVSFMIAALRYVPPLNLAMRNGERPRWIMGRLLSGRTVGIHGPPITAIFDPKTNTWTKGPDMQAGRYYPTATLTANSKVFITGGSDEDAQPNATSELYTPGVPPSTGSLQVVGNHYDNWYPHVYVLPDTRLAVVSRSEASIIAR